MTVLKTFTNYNNYVIIKINHLSLKEKKMKRLFSVVLVLLMLISVVPTGIVSATEVELIDINTLEVKLLSDERVYDGQVFLPQVSVTDGENTLSIDTDYTVLYENEESADAGEYTLTVNGAGLYTGEVVLHYTITKINIEQTADLFSLSQQTYSYTGAAIKPEVLFNEQQINADEFSVVYAEDTVNLGTKQISITANENTNYAGSIVLEYEIVKASIEDIKDRFSLSKTQFEYDGLAHNPAVLYNGETLPDVFEVTTADDTTNAGIVAVTVSAKEESYYQGEIELTYEILPKDITEIWTADKKDEADLVYNGQEQTPEVSVSDGESEVASENYDVSYENNVNVGFLTVTVTAKGNYTGTLEKEIEILPKELTAQNAQELEDVIYTSFEFTPQVVITDGEYTLVKDFDYTLTYENNINVGEATAKAVLSGNYTGDILINFNILQAEITEENVAFDVTGFVYNKAEQKPQVSVTVGEYTLIEGQDYSLCFDEDLISTGEKTVTVTGLSNFKGEVNKTYNIASKELTAENVAQIEDEVYTGSEITPEITVTDDEVTLEQDKDYSVVYENNINAGTAVIKVTGIGNYCGEFEVNFNITQKQIDTLLITGDYVYTGSEIIPQISVKAGDLELTEDDYDIEASDNINVGTANVKITAKGNYTGELSENFQIAEKDISEFDFRLTQYSFTYDQRPHCPDIENYLYNDIPLVSGTDYTVEKDRTTANVGSYEVVISGINNFTGTKTLYYTINEASLENLADLFELVDAGQTVTDSTYTYDEQEHIPSVLFNGVDVNSVASLRVVYNEDEDYYKTAGEKIITVYGDSPYTKSVELKYVINQYDINDYLSDNDLQVEYSYNGQSIDDGIVFKSEKITPDVLIADFNLYVDYIVTYTDNVNVGKACITVKGVGNYCGEVEKNFDILPLDISNAEITLNQTEFTYTGYTQTAKIKKVTVNGIALSSTDYSVKYSNNTYASLESNAKIALTGKGNFTGKAVAEYTIKPIAFTQMDPSIIKVETLDSYVYDAKAKTPKVTVSGTVNGVKYAFVEDRDFEVDYWNNVNAGVAQIRIKGLGNISGMYIKSFRITPVTIKAAHVTIDDSACVYTGSKVVPKVRVVINKKTISSSNYSLTLIDNVNAGTATVAVVGKGNYDGVVLQHFTISKRTLKSDMFTVSSSVAYTGKEVRPDIEYKNCKSSDFTVSYAYNVNYGTGTVTFKGKNNCVGTVRKLFTIVPKKVSGVKAESVSYNSVKISWNKISGVTGYEIFRATSENGTYKSVVRLKGYSTTTYTDNTLTAGLTYYYKVRAIKYADEKYCNGFYSTAVSVRPVPNKVVISSLRNAKSKTASLTFEKQSGVSGYQIYVSNSKTGGYVKLDTLKGASNVRYNHSSLVKGKTYYYRVRAYKLVDGEYVYGAFSTYKYVKITK